MEENQSILLSQCRSRISKSGKWMNLFSIFAAGGMVLMVAGGILLINLGNNLGESISSDWELVTSIAGIGLIVLAIALIFPLKMIRQAVTASREVRITTDVAPMLEALKVTHWFWKYMTWLVFLLLGFSCLAALLAFLYFVPVF